MNLIPLWHKHFINTIIQLFLQRISALCEQMFLYLAICPQSSWGWSLDGCICTYPWGFYWILQTIGIQSTHVRKMWPSFHSVLVSQCNILHPLLAKTMRNLRGVLNTWEVIPPKVIWYFWVCLKGTTELGMFGFLLLLLIFFFFSVWDHGLIKLDRSCTRYVGDWWLIDNLSHFLMCVCGSCLIVYCGRT